MPVNAKAEALRQFGAQLGQFKESLNETLLRTRSQVSHLGESWRDEQFDEFERVFSRTFPLIQKFVAEAERTIPLLHADADLIDEYAAVRPE